MADETILKLILRTLAEGDGAQRTAEDLAAMKKQAEAGSEALVKLATAEDEVAKAQKALRANTDPAQQEALARAVVEARVAFEQAKGEVEQFNSELEATDEAATTAAEQVEEIGNKSKSAGDESEGFVDRFGKDMQVLNDTLDVFNFALEGAAVAIETVSASAERLGRTEFKTALEGAGAAAQRLTDSLFELPIGKLVPAFQLFGDKALKDADAITIFQRALQGAGDGMNLVSAALIQMRAQAGEISWEEATRQINELTGAVADNRSEVQKAADATNAYAARWSGMATAMSGSTTAQQNWNQWAAANGKAAQEEAARVWELDQAQRVLAAGLSGTVGNAQRAYAATTAETSTEIERLKKEIAEAQANADKAAIAYGANSTAAKDLQGTVADLNGQLDEQTQKQEAAKAAVYAATAALIYQQVAASLDTAGQLELAFQLGMVDEASYKTAKAANNLTRMYDTNHDGVVSAAEGSDKYIKALHGLSTTVGNEATPAVRDHNKALQEAEQASGTTADAISNKAIPTTNNWRDSLRDAETAMGDAYKKAGDLKTSIEDLKDKTITVTTNWVNTGTPSGGGGNSGAPGSGAIPMAAGGDWMVTEPTLFLAGEAGPERATFTPLGSTPPSATTTTYQFSIAVDARGASDPAAIEAAGYRGAQRALAEAGYKADARRRV